MLSSFSSLSNNLIRNNKKYIVPYNPDVPPTIVTNPPTTTLNKALIMLDANIPSSVSTISTPYSNIAIGWTNNGTGSTLYNMTLYGSKTYTSTTPLILYDSTNRVFKCGCSGPDGSFNSIQAKTMITQTTGPFAALGCSNSISISTYATFYCVLRAYPGSFNLGGCFSFASNPNNDYGNLYGLEGYNKMYINTLSTTRTPYDINLRIYNKHIYKVFKNGTSCTYSYILSNTVVENFTYNTLQTLTIGGSTTPLLIGASSGKSQANNFCGHIYELLLFTDNSLNSTEMTSVENYLIEKWAIGT
jgi:hypothetical protein